MWVNKILKFGVIFESVSFKAEILLTKWSLGCDEVCICLLNPAGKVLESVSPVFGVSSYYEAVRVISHLYCINLL